MPPKARVIVAFADIRGSSRWTRRMGEDEDAREAFMTAYDRESLFFRDRTQSECYKRLGDGRMFVHRLTSGTASQTAALVLVEALGLVQRVDRLIAKTPSPRPAGFRIRLMSGIVINEEYPDGEKDWIGYVPNTCHKLLGVRPDVPVIVHESVRELISRQDIRARGFAFTPVKENRRPPDGVDVEDMNGLLAVSVKRRKPT